MLASVTWTEAKPARFPVWDAYRVTNLGLVRSTGRLGQATVWTLSPLMRDKTVSGETSRAAGRTMPVV